MCHNFVDPDCRRKKGDPFGQHFKPKWAVKQPLKKIIWQKIPTITSKQASKQSRRDLL
jgi:hypothetical protein